MHGNNVLAHVADLNGIVAGIELVLKDLGVVIIEVPYVKDMIDHVEFDAIYHEHLCYFSLTPLDKLFRRHQLLITNVERIPIHGGSLRIFVTKGGVLSGDVSRLLREEAVCRVGQVASYQNFGEQVTCLCVDLLSL